MFWIVAELSISIGPLADAAATPPAAPSTTPASTLIVVVPTPALFVRMPSPPPAVTFAVVVTEMSPISALKASMPFCAVAPVTVIAAIDKTETAPLPKLKAKIPSPPPALMAPSLTTLTAPLTRRFGVSVVQPK